MNSILLTDAYNLSHFFLKKNVDWEISLLFNRSKPMILFGFADVAEKIGNFVITHEIIDEAKQHAINMKMPFPEEMWRNVANDCDGKLPLKIEAVLDGTLVPKNTPFAKIKNTKVGYGELVTWFEPLFMQTSFDSGCATKAFEIRRYLDENKLSLNRVHSFGFRGHNSMENAVKAGKAWRLFLNGTDDFHTQEYTDGKGTSIPATAHKTIQQFDDEYEAYIYSIDATKENGFNIVAIVIDTYDPIRFIKYYSVKLAKYAKSKDVTIVFRPDSGLVKDQAFALYTLMHGNDLLGNTACIIGEGITFDKIKEYDKYFKDMGCDLNWFNYGMGSGFYKDVDRDYLGFAMKTSYSNGGNRMKFSADSFKQSIAGDVNLQIRGKDEYYATYDQTDSKYVKLYECGIMGLMPTWLGTKTRAEIYLNKPIQYEINISDDILKETERLRKKYITDVKVNYDTVQ